MKTKKKCKYRYICVEARPCAHSHAVFSSLLIFPFSFSSAFDYLREDELVQTQNQEQEQRSCLRKEDNERRKRWFC